MATRPDELPRWADVVTNNGPNNEANVSEPAELKKDRGWDWDERPPREYFNWLHLKTYEWLNYHRDLLDAAGQIVTNFSIDEETTSGLTLGILEGRVNRAQGLTTIAANTYSLTDNTLNRVYVELSGATIVVTTGAFPTENSLPLYEITTSSGSISNRLDLRTWASHPGQLVQNIDTLVDLQPSNFTVTLSGSEAFQVTDSRVEAKGGSPGTSGYTFVGDTDTGITSSGDKLAFFLGGTTAVMYYSLTGLGVNVDPDYTLQVAGGNNQWWIDTSADGEMVFKATNIRANGSTLSEITSLGKDTNNDDHVYASLRSIVVNNVNTAEEGRWEIYTSLSGSTDLQATFGTSIGEVHGTQIQNGLSIEDLGGDNPLFKMTSSTLAATGDGFQISASFSGAGITQLIGYDTDVIEIRPNNVLALHADELGRIGVGGNSDPQEDVHANGNIRADGEGVNATVSAHVGASNVAIDNDATRVALTDSVAGDIISRNKSTGKVFIDGPAGVNTDDPQYDLEVDGTFSAEMVVGAQYPETSTSGTTSIVDTGIIPQPGQVYEIIVVGNPNQAGSTQYRSIMHIHAYITGGNVGAPAFKFVNTVEKFSVAGLHDTGGSELDVAVTLWDGVTDDDNFPIADSPQLRIKVSGYNIANVGASQTVNIKRIN